MTIAAGFVTNEGIVLCADTQETISGYVKTYDGKVHLHIFPNLVISLVGSGHSDYIKTAMAAAVDEFPECPTLAEVEAELKRRLMAFFDEHISPWVAFPDRDRPDLELLIAVVGGNVPKAMFYYSGTAFYRTYAKAIGAGVLLANDMINRYCFGNFKLTEITGIAIHILSRVKEGVDGCGGHTHVVAIRGERDFALLEDKFVEQLENEFREIEKIADKDFIKKITAKDVPFSWQSEYKRKKTSLLAPQQSLTEKPAKRK